MIFKSEISQEEAGARRRKWEEGRRKAGGRREEGGRKEGEVTRYVY